MTRLLCASALLAGVSLPAFAERNTINLLIGGYFPKVDTQTRLDSTELNEGTLIEFEDNLNLDDSKTLPVASIAYNFGEKISVELAYLGFKRNGSLQIEETIEFGDETFDVDELIESKFNVDIYRLAFNYNFFQSPNWTLGAALGIHITDFDIGISAPERMISEEVDQIAPVPYLALNAEYRFFDRWQLGGSIEYFSLSAGDSDGSLVNITAGIDYSFSDSMGLGLAYNLYDLSVNSDSLTDDLAGEFQYQYSGPLVYFRVGF
jgi:hypothetical protein